MHCLFCPVQIRLKLRRRICTRLSILILWLTRPCMVHKLIPLLLQKSPNLFHHTPYFVNSFCRRCYTVNLFPLAPKRVGECRISYHHFQESPVLLQQRLVITDDIVRSVFDPLWHVSSSQNQKVARAGKEGGTELITASMFFVICLFLYVGFQQICASVVTLEPFFNLRKSLLRLAPSLYHRYLFLWFGCHQLCK